MNDFLATDGEGILSIVSKDHFVESRRRRLPSLVKTVCKRKVLGCS